MNKAGIIIYVQAVPVCKSSKSPIIKDSRAKKYFLEIAGGENDTLWRYSEDRLLRQNSPPGWSGITAAVGLGEVDGGVAGLAQCLEVFVGVGTAVAGGDNVVNMFGGDKPTGFEAAFAKRVL